MNEEEMMQKQQDMVQGQLEQAQTHQDLQAMQIREAEKNLIREQLSLDEELQIIENLLRGNIYNSKLNDWEQPKDTEMIILTEHGVHLIMNTIMFYLNKNTLLSNYDEDLINRKMLDFATTLADVIFMESDLVFQQPSIDEAITKYEKQLKDKIENRVLTSKIRGTELNYEDVKKNILKDIDVEKAVAGIKDQMKKNKLKRFEIIIREVQDCVHSTYLRALNGQERRTLRQHIHISEVTGSNLSQQQTGIKKNPLKFWK